MRILHVIHDFLPRHLAGSEIYAFQLCRKLADRHQVHVLCAEYDPLRKHGSITWRVHEGLPVIELVNNWAFSSFAESYQSPLINTHLDHVLRAVQPDILHIHNLLNLSMDLPALAGARGIPSVATLHDYTLVCPSGGQRVHLAEEHVCNVIDTERCSRCFPQSPFYGQMVFSRVADRTMGLKPAARVIRFLRSRMPGVLAAVTERVQKTQAATVALTARDIQQRLDKVRQVFESVDLFVAPSPALGAEYRRLGIPAGKLRISDYGFVPFEAIRSRPPADRLRIGFVGTLVWHKGVHILIDAARALPEGRFELKLFGDTEVFPAYVQSLRARASGLPVSFVGRFEPDRAREIYSQVDVLVVPSLWPENSPLVIHEAFMAGVPVVGSRQGGIPDLVTHDLNGLIYDAFSSSELAAALRTLIDNPERLRHFARRLPAVKSLEQDTREWEEIYHGIVNRRTAG